MEFKGFLLCFAFFFVVASGATVCKCGEEQKKKSVSEFAVKLNDGRKEIDEKITVDTENETETFHLEDDDTGNIHEVLFDFRREGKGILSCVPIFCRVQLSSLPCKVVPKSKMVSKVNFESV
ncbi:uncharacterized protein [Montipora capricornis]|uniref:uncharacterized protein isoform X2 n=1 Tax=Montipora capricornis TaxID=246305 RepID=UPI0035F146AB